ncbi:MAG TPA: lipoprotein insertase outer membrane protein LolB [Thauera sp.]|uniref:lipoprotein insertase outer membrane protein LolB n=1 Tax=Thauera sp. TaxID=1905334 RepID=UPI002BE53B3F|nr:lipoprotein insertase outer membrane protein LolB [Thauera sp.]HRP25409.1 lipoprotein insertase outer membrane protein LolB [Thauera sp.]HRP64627.1 lipoprotein insertase outer membrane protein LolB [Thauera sp.]
MSPQPASAGARRRRRRSLLVAAGACCVLAACAPLTPMGDTAAASRSALPAFLLEGRLSASDGQQAATGRVEWQHTPGADSLTLVTPLGQVAARLDSDAGGARLVSADGRRLEAASADLLLPQVLGIEVPVARLALWVQAAPDDSAEVRLRDAHGRPALLVDHGWRIDYQSYADDSPQALPARLDISRGDARLRLVIDSWTPLP